MTAVVELQGVTRSFGKGHTEVVALQPIDLDVGAGEFVAIMGPSGSGKTTLLSLVGGLDRPTGGQVVVVGTDVGALDGRGLALLRRRTVGYVFQDLNLLPGLTAIENVSLPLELDGRPLRQARAAAAEVLAAVGLADFADRLPDDLSGGEQQRVAIARALVGDRKILLADEPTSRRADGRPRLDHRRVRDAAAPPPLRRRRDAPLVVPIPEVLAAVVILPLAGIVGALVLSRCIPAWSALREASS